MKSSHKVLVLSIVLFLFAACGSGGNGGSLEGDAGNPYSATEKLLQDIHNPISSGACLETFVAVQDWSEELMNRIRSGDAACTKKVIEASQLDVNSPQSVFAQDQKIYPLWHALTTSALFFVNGGPEKAFQVVKVLVDAGADLSIKNEDNQTALQYSLENDQVFGRFPVLASYLILSGKTNLQELNKQGLSPFHVAIQRRSMEHVELMFSKGIDIHFPTSDGKIPILIAFDINFDAASEFLLQHGVDPSSKDKNGNTLVQVADSVAELEMLKKYIKPPPSS